MLDRILHRGLIHVDRGKPSLQALSFSMCCRYSSNVVAPMQRSSPRQRWLEHVAVHCPGYAGPDHGVKLVDEEDDLALRAERPRSWWREALLEFARKRVPRSSRRRSRLIRQLAHQAFRARPLSRSSVRAPRRWPSCPRRPLRSARGCSSCAGSTPGWRAGPPRSRPSWSACPRGRRPWSRAYFSERPIVAFGLACSTTWPPRPSGWLEHAIA